MDTARGWRGGQNQVLLTAVGLRERGHEVRVACRHGGELETRARAAGLEVDAVAFGGDLSPVAAWQLRQALRRFAPDVVQLHDPHAVSAGLLATAGSGTPLVGTRRVDFAVRGPFSRAKYNRCPRVIAVSRAIARVLHAGGVREDHVRVVYEGVPERAPLPGGREALTAAGVPPGARVVGNVAALTDHKDHVTLLEAFARLAVARTDTWLVIVGDGELRTGLERHARALGLDRCLFLGFRRDLDVLLPALDVFCLSSHMEGLGTSLLDAMCFSRPVAATAAGGIPEAVEDGVTGLVAPVRDAERLATALGTLLDDPVRARAMGDAGRRRFLERFTTARMVDATTAVYEEVA